MSRTLILSIAAFACAASLALAADEYPARAVRIVVPFAPGGGTDVVGRILARQLTLRLGQSFVIDNRPAGSGIIGADFVARAQADGYTLLFAFSSLSSSAKLLSHLPYDPVGDFAPVALATTSPLVLFVHPSVPATDVKQFIAYAKANPGKLNYGSSGPGSSPHLATGLLTPIAVGMPHARAGKLRALGSGGLRRSVAVPDLPTIDESGLPGFEVIGWWGMLAPSKTPGPVVGLLNREIRAVLDVAEVRRNLIEQGMDPAGGTPERFGALIKADMDKWGD